MMNYLHLHILVKLHIYYNKLVERDLSVFEGRDLLDILDDIETLS
jgi:hypothetical protein